MRKKKDKKWAKLMSMALMSMIILVSIGFVIYTTDNVQAVTVSGEPEFNRDIVLSYRYSFEQIDGASGDVKYRWGSHTSGSINRLITKTDAEGNMYMLTGQIEPGDSSYWNNSINIVKYNNAGEYQWGWEDENIIPDNPSTARGLAIGKDYLYVGDVNGNISKYSTNTGTHQWTNSLGDGQIFNLLTDSDHNIYFYTSNDTIYKYNNAGVLQWSDNFVDVMTIALHPDGYLYCGRSYGTDVRVIDTDTGAVTNPTSESNGNMFVIDKDGNIFVQGVGLGTVSRLNADLEIVWSVSTNTETTSALSYATNMVVTPHEYLYAVEGYTADDEVVVHKISYDGAIIESYKHQALGGSYSYNIDLVGGKWHSFPDSWNTTIRIETVSSDKITWNSTSANQHQVRINHGTWINVVGDEYESEDTINYAEVKAISSEGLEVVDAVDSSGNRRSEISKYNTDSPIIKTDTNIKLIWKMDDIRFQEGASSLVNWQHVNDVVTEKGGYVINGLIPIADSGTPTDPTKDISVTSDHPMTVTYTEAQIQNIKNITVHERSSFGIHDYDHGSLVDNVWNNISMSYNDMYDYLDCAIETVNINLGYYVNYIYTAGHSGLNTLNSSLVMQNHPEIHGQFGIPPNPFIPFTQQGYYVDTLVLSNDLAGLKSEFTTRMELHRFNEADIPMVISGHPTIWDESHRDTFESFVDWLYEEYGDVITNNNIKQQTTWQFDSHRMYKYDDDTYELNMEDVRFNRTIVWSEPGRYRVLDSDGERVGTLEVNSPEDNITLEGGDVYIIQSYSKIRESIDNAMYIVYIMLPILIILAVVKMIMFTIGGLGDKL